MHLHNKKHYTKGNAMIITVLFFTFLSLSIVINIVQPVVRETRLTKNFFESKQSYAASESGLEDVYYRLQKAYAVGSTETLTVAGATATTVTTDISTSQKKISSSGDLSNFQRKSELTVTAGVGVSFNYGLQTGYGGLIMGNNAGVVGNIYANGPIIGGSNTYITGAAYSADTPALSAEQINDTPTTPAQSITFGYTAFQDYAQSFQVSQEGVLNKFEFYIKKTSTLANPTVRIVTDNAGSPSTSTVASATLLTSTVGTNYGWVPVTGFSPANTILYPNITYWVVVDTTYGGATPVFTLGANTTYANGLAKRGTYSGTWSATSPSGLDSYFKLYFGGTTGSISALSSIGQTGNSNAYANSITNSTIVGTAYCKTGSGNNKTCNTSLPNPVSAPFPVSTSNIDDWKDDALAGGTIVGNYAPSGSAVSIGPKVITGNLTFTNNQTITLTGTLYVQGKINFASNNLLKLSSSYGSSSGVIVTDGIIVMANNTTVQGSGTTGSYLMMVTTSVCPNNATMCSGNVNAIAVSNNVGAAILVAPYGTIGFSNNGYAKEAIGDRVVLSNNAVITYETGLQNVNFTSGPSGSWDVSLWKEVQ